MGLDITWHRGLTKANGNEAFDEHGEVKHDDGWFTLYVNEDFTGRADEIKSRCAYRGEEEGRFHAGSYRGYNLWRDELAKLAGYPQQLGQERDSYAGAAVSAKLARDYAQHQAKADAHPDPHFRQLYTLWREAFEKASDGGCVRFH